jgi:hypothetical protein
VHDQAAETLEVKEPTSSQAIADRFNDVLEDFQETYDDNEELLQIECVDGRSASITNPRSVEPANEGLRKIKLRTEQIADLFDLDVRDFEKVDDVSEMRPIVIEQNTAVAQETTVSQNVEYSQLIDTVDEAMISGEDADTLKRLIQEFQEETEDGDTDESRLRDIVGRAKGIGAGVGTQVAAKLTMIGLKEGHNLIP